MGMIMIVILIVIMISIVAVMVIVCMIRVMTLVTAEGEPAYYAFRATQAGVRERTRVSAQEHGCTRRAARTDSLSVSAESQEGYRSPSRVSRPVAS